MVKPMYLVYTRTESIYSGDPIIRPPMVLVESGLNIQCSDQVSLMRPIYIENCISVLKQVVLIARVALIASGLYSRTSLYNRNKACHNL